MNPNIWGLEESETIEVIQAIWNAVYKGNTRTGENKLVHKVKKGDAVYMMVKFLLISDVLTSNTAA